MRNSTDIEIMDISTKDGKLVALISFRTNEGTDINNFYDTILIPINLRDIQYSKHGNILIDQSKKSDSVNESKIG